MTHNRICRAHAIGCAVENLRDRQAASLNNPVTTGDGYLAYGDVNCYCNHTAAEMDWAGRWVVLGLAALDAVSEPNGRTLTMSKVTIVIDTEDVATLREVFHLALVQSEAMLDDADLNPEDVGRAVVAHRAVVSLMARIDAMLPDSTGFFDDDDDEWLYPDHTHRLTFERGGVQYVTADSDTAALAQAPHATKVERRAL